MSAAEEAATSRRAALGAILGGAVAIPGHSFLLDLISCKIYNGHMYLDYFSAGAFAAYAGEKGRDANWQLKENGVLTGVVSSSMSGTRVSGFREALFGNNERAKTLPRNEIKGKLI